MISIEGYEYELVNDYREAFEEEVLKERYSDILAKYDYIVGDWGYNQLRLKGFFEIKIKSLLLIQKLARFKITYLSIAILAALILSYEKSGKLSNNQKKQQ